MTAVTATRMTGAHPPGTTSEVGDSGKLCGDQMSACLVLDDGRVLWRSNLAMEGLLHLIAEQVPEQHRELKAWLVDKGSRPAPFIDFDIRGLPDVHRNAFYTAAHKAMEELPRKDEEDVDKGYSAEALDMLLKMKHSIDRSEPPLSLSDDDKVHAFDGDLIDLADMWKLEAPSGSSASDSYETKSYTPVDSIAARICILLIVGIGIGAGMSLAWYFGQAEVSPVRLSFGIGSALVVTWGLMVWLLFIRKRP